MYSHHNIVSQNSKCDKGLSMNIGYNSKHQKSYSFMKRSFNNTFSSSTLWPKIKLPANKDKEANFVETKAQVQNG